MAIDTNLIEFCETERQQETILAVIAEGSNQKAAKVLNLSRRAVDKCVNRVKYNAMCRGYSPKHNINDPLPENLELSGVSRLVDNDGNTKLTWYKSKNRTEKAVENLIEFIENYNYKPIPKIKAPKKTKPELLSLYTITDFHLGMYAWAEETGEEWNTEIAAKVLMNAIIDMASKAPDSETAVLCLQGDFLHFDGLEAVTPSHGYILDADVRFSRMVELAMDLGAWAIETLLKKHKHVRIVICEGNHDLAGSAWLRKHTKRLWAKNKRVSVDDTDFPYYAYLHGETMIAWHHGHKTSNKSLPAFFSSDPRYRTMWGEASHTYIHTGHTHKIEQDMSEYGGAIVERHPTLATRDAYAARGGWVSRRSTKVITYSKVEGEVERSTVLPRTN